MPKLKESPYMRHSKIITANIRSRCSYLNCGSALKMAKKLGMSESTVLRRLREHNWSAQEVDRAAYALKTSFEYLTTDHSVTE